MDVLDLDAIREQELRGRGTKTLRLRGQTFKLPSEIPLEVGRLFAAGDVEKGLRILLGARQLKKLEGLPDVTAQDLGRLIMHLGELYALEVPGESPASVVSSPSTSRRSRPTSRASTG